MDFGICNTWIFNDGRVEASLHGIVIRDGYLSWQLIISITIKVLFIIRDAFYDERVTPIAIDVWDGKDLVWHLNRNILNAK